MVGLNDQLTGSIVQSAASATATMVDTRDSTLHVIIVASADGSGTLTATRSGTTVCTAPATIGNSAITAQCGGVLVTVQVFNGGAGAVTGTLTTQQVRA